MSNLEKLPVELFHEVAGCLVFADKKALSLTSKECHARLGPLSCPDQLSWIIYLCRAHPLSASSHFVQWPEVVGDVLIKTYYRLIYDDFWDLSDTSRHPITHERYGRRPCPDSEHPVEPLLLPYFDEPFPMSTLAYWYFSLTHEYAKCALRILNDMPTEALRGELRMSRLSDCKQEWREIESESRLDLGWLKRRKPVAMYRGSERWQRK